METFLQAGDDRMGRGHHVRGWTIRTKEDRPYSLNGVGQEYGIGAGEFRPRVVSFLKGNILLGCQLENDLADDARKGPAINGRGVKFSLPNPEDVGGGRFRDVFSAIEEQNVQKPIGSGLLEEQDVLHVVHGFMPTKRGSLIPAHFRDRDARRGRGI